MVSMEIRACLKKVTKNRAPQNLPSLKFCCMYHGHDIFPMKVITKSSHNIWYFVNIYVTGIRVSSKSVTFRLKPHLRDKTPALLFASQTAQESLFSTSYPSLLRPDKRAPASIARPSARTLTSAQEMQAQTQLCRLPSGCNRFACVAAAGVAVFLFQITSYKWKEGVESGTTFHPFVQPDINDETSS